ncbi:Glutathione S-transferase domain protein [Sphingobium chlorophenolicum L-1]|uniref:Glutathione S-transferase domain protein n=1 Tax=Sphingobium chlorophenolicum L-1 TaxID=690566 RepID=F6F136_SPHCR|nr:glutathione S-transferase family protein [Sphingobium chlorophenolicum]AEG51252.1 Glutathione S-transferase domain protein [Sphingobium chlorophenolicum L-1]
MILYAITLSPFAARVRLALRIKKLDYDMMPPPGGSTRSPEYLAINPIGKLPVLVTDEGLAIAESETIVDYLDEYFPTPSLTPSDTAERVRMRNIIRCFELYATPAMSRLFRQMDPATRDEAVVATEIANWRNGLALTDRFVADAAFAAGGAISKADCILLPSLLLCEVVAGIFGLADPLAECPNLVSYRDKARQHPDMGAIWTETAEALAAMRSGR